MMRISRGVLDAPVKPGMTAVCCAEALAQALPQAQPVHTPT
ncbi:hypothetical protein M2175_005520 [Bradyrhizobium elkanii]|nr:hypothetical protein [Bradyrhizobium elkanii]MCS3971046.1 hypothetical protein [Bradyrhizobium japonicum]